MNTSTTPKQYKRQDRSVSPETAQKISASLKAYNATHPRNPQWCKKISDALKNDYWASIKPKDNVGQDGTTIEDIML